MLQKDFATQQIVLSTASTKKARLLICKEQAKEDATLNTLRIYMQQNSVECCIAEINPAIGSIISVADVKANDKLRILNLSKTFAISSKIGALISGVTDSDVFLYLQNLFSRPHQNDEDYYLTQYISEKIKSSGFDGLSFHSSKYAHKNTLGMTEYGYRLRKRCYFRWDV